MVDWKHAKVAVAVRPEMNFDDIRDVQRYLQIKMLIKRAEQRTWDELAKSVFSVPSHPAHPDTWEDLTRD